MDNTWPTFVLIVIMAGVLMVVSTMDPDPSDVAQLDEDRLHCEAELVGARASLASMVKEKRFVMAQRDGVASQLDEWKRWNEENHTAILDLTAQLSAASTEIAGLKYRLSVSPQPRSVEAVVEAAPPKPKPKPKPRRKPARPRPAQDWWASLGM